MYSFTINYNSYSALIQCLYHTKKNLDKKKIKFLKKQLILIGLLLLHFTLVFAQKQTKIKVENSDFVDVNEIELPNATLLTGNVRVIHDGIVMTCNKAYYFKDENYIKAFGNVEMVQGDTLYLNSKYAEYNGNVKKAFATGDVVMQSPESKMSTDTLSFDRNSQEAFFNNHGTINNRNNVLKSKVGRYYVAEKKYQFLTSVVLKNPEYTIKSNHLDYYTTQGDSYLLGPSTITGKENFIYTENGYYNSKKNIGNFKRKSYIKYKDRLIEGDSLYYDRKKEFASGTHSLLLSYFLNMLFLFSLSYVNVLSFLISFPHDLLMQDELLRILGIRLFCHIDSLLRPLNNNKICCHFIHDSTFLTIFVLLLSLLPHFSF